MLLAALALVALTAGSAVSASAEPGGAEQPAVASSPFDRQGMWIWYVDSSDGGDLSRIIARAKRFQIGTLYIKSGDAGSTWSQFTPSLIERLHEAGLSVCAWQFVYGDSPVAEAKVGAASVSRGADCLVIDAEGQYEGKYAAADRYIRALRARIGEAFPLSLSSFPYVDYHPSFPYSVFLGPGGATYNQPQMYWKAIGTSVRAVYEHTYLFNRVWERPVYPIGQTYLNPGHKPIRQFRRFATIYGGLPTSWWSWQETSGREWGALAAPAAAPIPGYRPMTLHPVLKRGSRGDLVVWAQTYLRAAVRPNLPVTGIFGNLTRGAVRTFQAEHGLRADGVIGTATWDALHQFEPVRPGWAAPVTRRNRASTSGAVQARRPLSASLPAKAYEINPGPRP
ncbi:MAG: peptidoglycan-binding domain-containing protein [Solirubrobacterales bacterium]